MLRQNIDNKEKEKKEYEAKFVQLEQKNLKAEIKINSLEQELETKCEVTDCCSRIMTMSQRNLTAVQGKIELTEFLTNRRNWR